MPTSKEKVLMKYIKEREETKLSVKIFNILSDPPKKDIQGIKVNAWKIPEPRDRKAMAEAIAKELKEGKC